MSVLTNVQLFRAAGVLLGTAAGDALGAGYEFGEAFEDKPDIPVEMIGGGPFGFEPYEWTDDTSMAITLAQALAFAKNHSQLRPKAGEIPDEILDRVVNGWYEWSLTAKDVGVQTRSILSAAKRIAKASGRENISSSDALKASEGHHTRTGRSAGNGSLMRTAPLALAFLQQTATADASTHHDYEAFIESTLMSAACRVSALTHWDRDAQEACGIWCIAIRHAVLTGELDVRKALRRPSLFSLPESKEKSGLIPEDTALVGQNHNEANVRVQLWESRITKAENSRPSEFKKNGWVVEALQGAWSSIYHANARVPDTTSPTPMHGTVFHLALEFAVRGGNDTDTVAAIAGGLIGAVYGSQVIPEEWRNKLHGWPGLGLEGLEEIVEGIVGSRKDVA